MGYDMERLIDIDRNAINDLTCVICTGILQDPKVTDCDHAFCSTCILHWIATRPGNTSDSVTASCPLCTETINTDDLNAPSRLLQNMLNNVRVKCHRDGCDVPVRLDELDAHNSECNYRKLYERIDLKELASVTSRVFYSISLIVSLVTGLCFRNDCNSTSILSIPLLLTLVGGTGLLQYVIQLLRERNCFVDRKFGILHVLRCVRIASLLLASTMVYFRTDTDTLTNIWSPELVSNAECNQLVTWTSLYVITMTTFYEIHLRVDHICNVAKRGIVLTYKWLF